MFPIFILLPSTLDHVNMLLSASNVYSSLRLYREDQTKATTLNHGATHKRPSPTYIST
jgi:hypothetical protein